MIRSEKMRLAKVLNHSTWQASCSGYGSELRLSAVGIPLVKTCWWVNIKPCGQRKWPGSWKEMDSRSCPYILLMFMMEKQRCILSQKWSILYLVTPGVPVRLRLVAWCGRSGGSTTYTAIPSHWEANEAAGFQLNKSPHLPKSSVVEIHTWIRVLSCLCFGY